MNKAAVGVAALFASGAIAATACGGKLLPVDTDAGDAGDAAPDYGDAGPFVTRVTPDSGPNSGGTRVTVDGYGFVPGRSDVTFAGFPATGSCASRTQCIVVSPYAGHQGYDQYVHVQVAVPAPDDAGQISSPATPLDVFTYTAGPQCDLTLSCAGVNYYPDMVIACPTVVTFYSQFEYQLTDVLTRASTYKTGTEDFPIQVVACYGDSTDTSCTTFVSVSTPFNCASPDAICAYCKQLGGKCSAGPNPTCTKHAGSAPDDGGIETRSAGGPRH